MRVSLNPVRRTLPGTTGAAVARALLDEDGPFAILGDTKCGLALAEPIVPSATSLFGPRGVAFERSTGPLFVSDTGHHRLLIWNSLPREDGVRADILIGQPDFSYEGRNAKGPISPATLNVPTGVAISGGVLAVADAWNHRVLIWFSPPKRDNQPADVVLGQADFASGLANRGSDVARADTLNWCYGVTIANGALYVSDTGNRRVLKWHRIPEKCGAPADVVLGQRDFDTRDENAGHAADAESMRWPHAVLITDTYIAVADAGNNRIMVWSGEPRSNGAPCDFVIGQRDFTGVDHNQAAYYPNAQALNMPYGLAQISDQLATADTANSRIVGYDLRGLEFNGPATTLSGQPTFADKGDNRWGVPKRDSLCWPYGLAAAGNTLAIADSGNNRILLWEAAP